MLTHPSIPEEVVRELQANNTALLSSLATLKRLLSGQKPAGRAYSKYTAMPRSHGVLPRYTYWGL